jgi:hypothetical protein
MFKRYAYIAKQKGYTHFSANAITHRMRWELAFERPEGEQFKINDHYSARMARELEEEVPEFTGFFRSRRLRTS